MIATGILTSLDDRWLELAVLDHVPRPSDTQYVTTLFDSIQDVRRALESSDLFVVTKFDVGSPVDASELARVEKRLGTRLPSRLRAFYQKHGSVYFSWNADEHACVQRGYPEDQAQVEAVLSITPLSKLAPIRDDTRVVPFTSDFVGRSWCLDLRWGVEPTPMLWYESAYWRGDDHDPMYDSFDEMWDELVRFAFVSRPDSSADRVFDLIQRRVFR